MFDTVPDDWAQVMADRKAMADYTTRMQLGGLSVPLAERGVGGGRGPGKKGEDKGGEPPRSDSDARVFITAMRDEDETSSDETSSSPGSNSSSESE